MNSRFNASMISATFLADSMAGRRNGAATPQSEAPSTIALAMSIPDRIPPDAIRLSRLRYGFSAISASGVGMPQSWNSRPILSFRPSNARCSIRLHEVPPVPATSMYRMP